MKQRTNIGESESIYSIEFNITIHIRDKHIFKEGKITQKDKIWHFMIMINTENCLNIILYHDNESNHNP